VTSHPNVDLARSIFAKWERGEFLAAAEWAHPEIEYVIADGPDPGAWIGLAGLAEGARGWLAAAEGVRLVADDYRELDRERVLVLIHRGGRGKASGLELGPAQTRGAILLHVRDGMVTRLVAYWNRERVFADLSNPDA
jgi:ketosteroid isomerase-like protein